MTVNPEFSKSCKLLNSILKIKQKNRSKMSQSASQETQTSNCLMKRLEHFWGRLRQKALQTLINDNFRWSKSSIKIILIYIFSGFNLLLNQEMKVKIYNQRVGQVNDR